MVRKKANNTVIKDLPVTKILFKKISLLVEKNEDYKQYSL